MSSRRRLDLHNHHERSHKQNLEHTAQLTSLNTSQTATNDKLDTLSGAINNNIGDAQVKLQTFVYGHDSGNGLARPLAVTANGELKVSNDVLEVSAETVNLNTDTLEAKTQAITDKLDTFAGAGNNNVGEGSSKLQTYLYARNIAAGHFKPIVCNSSAQLEVAVASTALPTGAATESTLSGLKNSLTGDGAGGDNAPGVMLKDINDNIINTNTVALAGIDTTLQGQDNILDDIKGHLLDGLQISKIMGSEDGSTSGTQRQIHVDGNGNVLTSLVSSVNVIPANSVNSHITDDPANSVAVGLTGRTTIGTATTQKHLLCNTNGELNVSNTTNKSNGSEVSYVSGQAISGSGTHTGASISISPNVEAIFLEHNFSNSAIAYTMQASIDGTNFFDTPNVFNSVGATTTGINLANGIGVSGGGFTPHIRFKFTDTSGSSQTITLSYMLQSS